MRPDGQKGWEEHRDVVVYLEIVKRGRRVQDLRLGVGEVGYVMLVEVTALEGGTIAGDEMVPMGVGSGLAAAWKGSCWRAIAMGVLESWAGQVPGTLEESG